MPRVIVPCPAKVNLFLAVGPKDRRGYHPLRTIFQAVGLFDELDIRTDGEPGVRFNEPSIPPENTLTRTLRLLQEVVDVPPLSIDVRKEIPSESGLGGGSSDAAGLIRALQQLLPGKMAGAEVQSVAAAVGADVPFFLVGGRARAEGYGERLTPLPDAKTRWLTIVKPPIGCPTGPAYARLDEAPYEWKELPDEDLLYNDFERVMPCECGEAIERLMVLGAGDAGLTGSGSAVFGRFQSQELAQAAKENAEQERLGHVWVVPTLSRAESLLVVPQSM